MPLMLNNLQCCGVKEIHGLSTHKTPEEAFRYFGMLTTNKKALDCYTCLPTDVTEPWEKFRYVMFTQAKKSTDYGERFAAFLAKKRLGDLLETGFHVNPSADNNLKVWIWTVDWRCVRQWFEQDAKKATINSV